MVVSTHDFAEKLQVSGVEGLGKMWGSGQGGPPKKDPTWSPQFSLNRMRRIIYI
jgi:hypothetical protein